jgi:hypothetical protein
MSSSIAKMTGSSKYVIADTAWIAALVQVKRRPQGAARDDTKPKAPLEADSATILKLVGGGAEARNVECPAIPR